MSVSRGPDDVTTPTGDRRPGADPATRPGPVPRGAVPTQAPPPERRSDPPASTGGAAEFERPSSARVIDYLLGGAAHGAVDRALGDRLVREEPAIVAQAREHRAFLRRSVQFLLATGIDQFLDLGSGIPTMGHVHEVVARSRSAARVAYVDIDSIAALYGEHLLAAVPTATYTVADIRDADAVLAAPGVGGLLDLTRPVGLLALSVLQHVPDDPKALLEDYLRRLPSGSALALSHYSTDDPRSAGAIERLTASYPRSAARTRGRAEVEAALSGIDLVEPGLCWAARWRPDPGRPTPPDHPGGHWVGVGFRR